MKKLFQVNSFALTIGIVSIFFIIPSCSQDKNAYQVKGVTNAVDTGKIIIYTTDLNNNNYTNIDSGRIENGHFELQGKIDSAQMVNARIMPGNIDFGFFLENKKIQVAADTAGSLYYHAPGGGNVIGRHLKTVKETGNAALKDINNFLNDANLINTQKSVDSLNVLVYKAKDNPKQVNALKAQIDSLAKGALAAQREKLKIYIKAHAEAPAGAYMLWAYNRRANDLTDEDLEDFVKLFMGKAKQTTYYGNLLREVKMRKAVQIGQLAPDFSLLKRDSSTFTLSKIRGQYVLLDFWASWCVPCRIAIPHWKEVYQKYHKKGFEIVSISDDRLSRNWIKAMEVEKMPWTQLKDSFPYTLGSATVITLYMAHAIPHYVLLDKTGRILIKATGDHQVIDKKLEELFGS